MLPVKLQLLGKATTHKQSHEVKSEICSLVSFFFSGELEVTRESMRNITKLEMCSYTPDHNFYVHTFTHNRQTDSNICAGTDIKALIHTHASIDT